MSTRADPGPLLIVAGEASGDLHGARLLGELDRLLPGVERFGLGGDELAAAGVERVADASEISVVGISEVLKVLPRARQIFDRLVAEAERRRPALAVLIDFPEFNLRLARELKRLGIPVVYYISPQIWAWRRRRVELVAERVEEMLVLFPFEVDFYRRHGVVATCVGHPLVDEVPALPGAWDDGPPAPGEPYRVALLPGSRSGEVSVLLPIMLGAVRELARSTPLSVRLIKARSVRRESLGAVLSEAASATPAVAVEVVEDDRFSAIADSHLALCASGTATLEVGLLRTPQLVLYRLSAWSWMLAKLLVRLPHASLVNLVMEREVVPELLQSAAEAGRVAREAAALLADRDRVAAMREDLAALRQRLGSGGASERAAERVAVHLGEAAPAPAPAAGPGPGP